MTETRYVLDSSSASARALRRGVGAGTFRRVHVGAYVDADAWKSLTTALQHLALVKSVVRRLKPGVVVSHGSAAVLHGLPEISGVPRRVHVTDPTRETAHTWKAVTVHGGATPSRRLTSDDVVEIDGVRVTSILRTIIDQALSLPFVDAVVQIDAVLHRRELHLRDAARGRSPRYRGAWVSREEMLDELARRPGARARRSARNAIEFGSGLADTPGESVCRVTLREIGAPPPVLQREFADEHGLIGFADFWFEEEGAVVEFDGLMKYRERRYASGREADEAVVKEKIHEDRIRADPLTRAFGRCLWVDARSPTRMRALLRRLNVPTR